MMFDLQLFGDINVNAGDGGESPNHDEGTLDLAQTVGAHDEAINRIKDDIAGHDGAIEEARSLAQGAHDRLDSIVDGGASQVADLANRVETIAADLAEFKAQRAIEESEETIEDGGNDLLDDGKGAASEAIESVESPEPLPNAADDEKKKSGGIMGFLRSLEIH